MPKVGVEPTRANAHYALNVARLPIPPLRRGFHLTEVYYTANFGPRQFDLATNFVVLAPSNFLISFSTANQLTNLLPPLTLPNNLYLFLYKIIDQQLIHTLDDIGI